MDLVRSFSFSFSITGPTFYSWLDAARNRSASKFNKLPHSNRKTRHKRVFVVHLLTFQQVTAR